MTIYKAAEILRELVEMVNKALSVSEAFESRAFIHFVHSSHAYQNNLAAEMNICNRYSDFPRNLGEAQNVWEEVGKKFSDDRWAKSCHEAIMMLFSSMKLSVVGYKLPDPIAMIGLKALDGTAFVLKMPIPLWMQDWYHQTCVTNDVKSVFETKFGAEAGAAVHLIYAALSYMDIREVLESQTPWIQMTMTDKDAMIEDVEKRGLSYLTIEDLKDTGKMNCWYMMTGAAKTDKFKSEMFTDVCGRYFEYIQTNILLFRTLYDESQLLTNTQCFTVVSLVPDFRRGKITYSFH